ncbi:MAG: pectate lyase [Pseudomonadota bacterium]
MAGAVATATSTIDEVPVEQRHRVVITSVGSAVPASARSVAVGLGVSVQSVLNAFYKAPVVLVDGLSRDIAEKMSALLTQIGCKVQVQAELDPAPAPAILYDVALHVTDPARYGEICRAIGGFVGAGEEDAARLVSTPPGIVLGGVSRATADALANRLGDGAELALSRPEEALYDVFLGACDGPVRSRLFADLKSRGFEPVADQGCILTGLDKATADQLWTAHRAGGRIQIVNRDFLRFDIVMTGGADSPAARTALTEIAGVPDSVVPDLFRMSPITVMEAVASRDLEASFAGLADAGLELRADLLTFLHLGVAIVGTDDPHATLKTLTELGLWQQAAMPPLPWRAPWHMPELQARILRNTLERAGAHVDLIDPPEGTA